MVVKISWDWYQNETIKSFPFGFIVFLKGNKTRKRKWNWTPGNNKCNSDLKKRCQLVIIKFHYELVSRIVTVDQIHSIFMSES